MKGNLSKAIYSVDDYNVSVEYDHIRDSFDPSQYDKTTFEFVDSTILTKMFSYWDNNGEDPLNRLTKILYSMTGLGNFQQNFVYETDHYRIKQTDYYFGESDARNIKYEYQYDSLGNIIEEKTIRFSTINGVYYTSVVKSYEYDDLNQLAIEDVLYNTDPSASYTNIFHYDSRGNLLNLTTYEYGVRDHEIPSFLYNCQCSIPVYMKYNTTKYYTDIYAIEVGQAPQINFSYINPVNQSLYIGVNTVLLSSTLDINSEGYYYNYYRAYNSNQSINIYFRIVIMVGDIDPNKKVTYTYDTDWSDQLVSYGITANGSTVNHILTYDNQGNPTQITNFQYNGITYNHADLLWDGRELANIKVYSSSGSTTKVAEIWYTYNDQGYRVSKTLDTDGNGVFDKKYVYLLSGDFVLSEIVSLYVNSSWVEDYQINYLFEHDGSAVGFELLDNGVINHYLYVKNLQGDITQIIRDDGTIVVDYIYDAFGQILAITGSLSTTIGEYNSLRYRSYKYDNELKFYYLNSRYYNPEIGRFISSDGQIGELGNILSTNMYAYCASNPVMYSDTTGYAPEAWQIALGVIGAALVVTAIVMTIFSSGGVGAFGVGALWGSLILGTAGAVIGGVVANAINADILGGILAGFGIGASIGFFAGGLYTYSHYRGAVQFLANSTLDKSKQAEILGSFRKGSIRMKKINAGSPAFRYWGGSAREVGMYMSPKYYSNPTNSLALDPKWGNTADKLSVLVMRNDIMGLTGRAAAQGVLRGGGVQWVILDLANLLVF